MARDVPRQSGRTSQFRLWKADAGKEVAAQKPILRTTTARFEESVAHLLASAGALVRVGHDGGYEVTGHQVFRSKACAVECMLVLTQEELFHLTHPWPVRGSSTNLLIVANRIPRPVSEPRSNIEIITFQDLATYLAPWIAEHQKLQEQKRAPSVAGAVAANRTSILLSLAAISALIADRIVRLHDERSKRNDPDTMTTIDQSIADYEGLASRVTALEKAVREYRPGHDKDTAVAKPAKTFKDGVKAFWDKSHQRICTNAYDAGVFASLVGVCVAAGASGGLAVTIPAVLVGGKPVAKVIGNIAKGFLKSSGKE